MLYAITLNQQYLKSFVDVQMRQQYYARDLTCRISEYQTCTAAWNTRISCNKRAMVYVTGINQGNQPQMGFQQSTHLKLVAMGYCIRLFLH